MQNYDPMLEVDAKQWDLLDEDERVNIVMKYHQEADIELPDEHTPALLHVVVENQIARGQQTPVEAALHRLTNENLDRHDAIHAIAKMMATH